MIVSARRLRHTMIMMLTYELGDLLADMGGYLGLLLGASLLSVYGTGHKMIRRLVRQALAKHRRQQAANEEEQNDTETAWSLQQRRRSVRCQ